jgi:alkanesulfonate monooxygenase SsuD/methylene tetrahydromethanopterin reductase-like flavin-dependent oxidoreductase (luciferase family)
MPRKEKTMTSINSINSISGGGMMPPPPPMGRGAALSDDQKTQLSEILDKYDPENMTDESIQSMRDEIKEAGIRPSAELKNILEDSGFEVGPPQGGPPPMGMQGANKPTPPQFVQDFVDKAVSGDITEDDVAYFLEMIQTQNQDSTGLVVNELF